ncbi:MAG: hypothetical protein ACI4XP_00485 [Acutalibacteraceae bacterium]
MNPDGSYKTQYRPMVKMIDHLHLEAQRLEVTTKNENQFKDLNVQISGLKEELKKTTKKLDKATRKAKLMQTEFISILSVFSAVILVFFVDTEYITKAVASMQNGSVFRLVLVLSICGLILFNGLYLLFTFISFIINRNSDDSDNKPKFSFAVVIVNVILLLLIIFDFLFWCFGVFEIAPFNKL